MNQLRSAKPGSNRRLIGGEDTSTERLFRGIVHA